LKPIIGVNSRSCEMENNIEDSNLNDEHQNSFFSAPIGLFFTKTFIIIFGIYLLISFLLPDLSSLKKLETDQNKYIALSFIQNPRILLELSKSHEAKGHINSSIRDINVAIGLLELHNANKETMNFYNSRLIHLKKMELNI